VKLSLLRMQTYHSRGLTLLGGLDKSVTSIRVQNLFVVEDTTRTGKEEYSGTHVEVITRASGRVRHSLVHLGLVVLARFASSHLEAVSNVARPGNGSLHTSLGKTPGAIVLTRTLVPAKVVASIRDRCVVAALLAAYANWPELLPFMEPEMDETLMTLDVYPGVTSLPLARRGRNAMDM
jgi:hypothetical protein